MAIARQESHYFLWHAVSEKCYTEKSETIQNLKANIRSVIADIRLHALKKVPENACDRMRYCEASRWNHMNEIFFHF